MMKIGAGWALGYHLSSESGEIENLKKRFEVLKFTKWVKIVGQIFF